MLLFGGAGAGKTTAALNFERAYVIDGEKGTAHYAEQIRKAGSAVFDTTDLAEVIEEVKTLISEEHDYRTVIIDPVTTIWNDWIDKCEKKVGSEFGRHVTEAGKTMKRLLNLLTALDCNVIMTAHGRIEYGDGMVKLGTTFDGFKKLDYHFDLVMEIKKQGKGANAKRVAEVIKSRLPQHFPDGAVFPWNYGEFAKRYDATVLERKAVPVALATPDQLQEIKDLLHVVRLEEGLVEKWFTKANVDAWADMPAETIAKCIQYVKGRLPGNPHAGENGTAPKERRVVPVGQE